MRVRAWAALISLALLAGLGVAALAPAQPKEVVFLGFGGTHAREEPPRARHPRLREAVRYHDAENSLPVTVEGVSFLGPVTRYRLSAGPARLTASVHDGDLAGPAEIGRALFAEWRAADCLLLDETPRDPLSEPARGDLGGRRA